MIALRNMFVLTILVLSILGSTFARVYLLDGSTDQSSSATPQSSALIQPQLNTSIFLVNHTTTQPPTTHQPPRNHPLNATNARQIDFDNPIYYQEENAPSESVKTDQLSYNESNFTYGNINLRRASHLNGGNPHPQERSATKNAGVTLDNGYVPISRGDAGVMSELQIAHLMNSGVPLHRRQQMDTRRQHSSLGARQNGPLTRPMYAKPPHGHSNRHKISSQLKQGPALHQVPGNLSRNYYETSRRPVQSHVVFKPQKRQPLMPNSERFRTRPVNTIPIGLDPHLFLKTNISSAFQRQFVKHPTLASFAPHVGLTHSGQQPNFGQDSKATGDESLENYQTLGANLGPTLGSNLGSNLGQSPKRIYRPAPLTGPFYTYPNIMQRPNDSKIMPAQMFTPGTRSPNFAHGNLGDRYPLRQHPQAISTSLRNNNPISLPPNSLQNINFQSPGQLQVLQIQPELSSQYASSFPTLSQQTSQYDQHITPYAPANQGQASPSPSRYPFQPTLEPATPTRISSSLLNAGHGLSGRNPYQQEDTPTVYKVQGTYTEAPAKPQQSPIKPSVQYDEDAASGLSAILNANYRQPESPSRFKPEETEIRFKPEDASTRYKSEEVYRFKPNEQSSRYKPQDDETRYKTEESSYDYKPKEASSSKYKPNNRPSLPGPPYEDDDDEIQLKFPPAQKPIHEQDEEFTYQDSPSSYDAPLNPKLTYNDYKDADDADAKSPSYPPYPPGKDAGPGSVQEILAGSSGRVPSTSYGVPDSSLHGNSYDPHGGGGHKKGGHVHTFVKTTKEGHFKWGVRHSASAH